jgi:hypothetical protein
MAANKILFAGVHGHVYKCCLDAIKAVADHERSPLQVYSLIDECLKTVEFQDREEREKCRNAMISRLEPYIHYGRCEACGARLLISNDSFCSRTCEVRYTDWR